MMSYILGLLSPLFLFNPLLWWHRFNPPPQPQEWYVQTAATSVGTSSAVVVTTGTQASSTTLVLNAPYGIQSEIVSSDGKTYATTTPLTKRDIEKMQQQQTKLESQMNQIMQNQERMFQTMWN